MARRLALLVVWGSTAVIVLSIIGALYLLLDIEAFASLARQNLSISIYWNTVTSGQWYGTWLITVAYASVGLWALYFLRRAFSNFAAGEFFTAENSRDLRLFAKLFVAQALVTPLLYALSSVVLSLNHPQGQKVLAIAFGSQQIKTLFVALVLWVVSDMLVRGIELESENKQFV